METTVKSENLELSGWMGRRLLSSWTAEVVKRRRGARGVTLVEVLIVVAIMAVISGGVTLVAFPLYNEARYKMAVQGCQAVRSAAELYINLDASADACPTMQDLVNSRKIDKSKTDDPWGSPYRIDCSDPAGIHVFSNGKDKKQGTGDDLRDDFKDADIKRAINNPTKG